MALVALPVTWIHFSAGMQKASQRHANANNRMDCFFNLSAARALFDKVVQPSPLPIAPVHTFSL